MLLVPWSLEDALVPKVNIRKGFFYYCIRICCFGFDLKPNVTSELVRVLCHFYFFPLKLVPFFSTYKNW